LSGLCQTEVEDFHPAIFGDEDVVRLQVAVHDSFVVGGGESVGHLNPVVDRFPERQWSCIQALAESFTLQQFGNQEVGAVLVAHVEDGKQIVMVQRAENSRFLLKALQTIGIGGKGRGKEFQGDTSIKARVARAVNLTHAACTEWRLNFIGAEFGAGGEGHQIAPL
jgi:hypothetical protein